MAAFMCCFWWFLLGVLLGWLLNWLLCRWCCKTDHAAQKDLSSPPAPSSTTSHVSPLAQNLAGHLDASQKASPIDFLAAAAAGFHVKGDDDLAIIEGIGPKIRALFNASGVRTFEQLSKMSVEQMKTILDGGGARFKLANPGSWAEQATLAHRNEWAALKTLQDNLDAGVAH